MGITSKEKKRTIKQAERQIVRNAPNSTKSASKIKEFSGVKARLSTVQRTISTYFRTPDASKNQEKKPLECKVQRKTSSIREGIHGVKCPI